MRLIDADELMTEIMDSDLDHLQRDDWKEVIQIVQDAPTIQMQWIPCSERLPETHKAGNSVSGIFMQSKPVLVYGVPEDESEYSFNVVTYCDDLNGITYWCTEMDAVTINKVTTWMPLPEPYKEGHE